MGEKAPISYVTNSNTALVVRRIKDDLTDTLDFRNKLRNSDLRYIYVASVLSESENES